jgi:Tol biopolymer transport system component
LQNVSPDGKVVASIRGNALYVTPVGGGPERLVVDGGREELSHVQWSPDSRRLSFLRHLQSSYYTLEAISAYGSNRRRFFTASALDAGSWSPDGRKLAFWAQRGSARAVYVPTYAWVGDAVSGRVRRLAGPHVDSTSWSPRGDWIAYVRAPISDSRQYLMLVRSDGRRARQLAWSYNLGPFDWFPDGKRIAACTQKGMFIVGTDGRRLRRLLERC